MLEQLSFGYWLVKPFVSSSICYTNCKRSLYWCALRPVLVYFASPMLCSPKWAELFWKVLNKIWRYVSWSKAFKKKEYFPCILGRMKIIETKIEFCMGPQTEHKERVNNLWFTLQAMSSPHPQLYSKILPIPSPSHSKPLFSFVA